MDSKNQTFATRAFAADFAIDQLSSKEAFRLIDDSRRDLEKSSIGLTVLGKQLLARGEFRRAISFLRRAVARGPIDLDAEFLLGMAHMRAGEYGAAEDIFNRLISMRPDHVRYQVSLGAVYRHRGKLMESLAVLEAAEKKEPDNTMILVELAQTCFALSWYRRAGQFLERAQQLKPDENVILVDLGIVYWHENRRSDAVRCFREAERQYEGNQASVVNIGTTDFLQGDIDAAIAAYKKANRFGKKNPTVLHNLAVVYLRKGKLKTAARYLDELLLLTPGRSDLLLQRALLARKLGNKEDAELAYRRILENDPADQTAIAGLVELLIHQGRLDEAMFRIESFLENMPARPDFLILLADIYRARGWYEVALTKYQIAVRDFPEYGHGYLGVGRCMYDMIRYKKSTRYDETLFALKLASGKMPSDPEPHVLMGDVYMDYKGYRDMAIEQWEAALAKTGDERKKKLIEKKIVMAGRR